MNVYSNTRRLLAGALLFAVSATTLADVNVYSARKEALIKPLLDQFSESSGIKVNLVTGKGDALLTRLKNEGRNTPADVLITTDAGRLYRAEEAGVLQAISSENLDAAIPEHLRSDDGYWYGLSVRARAIVYAKDRVQPSELSTYEALATPEWKGRVCIRSSGNIYNQSLVAGMLATQGADKTAAWLENFVPNFARPPQGGDRDQIAAVAAGQCDVAVVNSYYFGGMINGSDTAQREAAAKVAIFWPNQNDRGTHINVSGAGVTAASDNVAQAIALIEFLTTEDSQSWYAQTNNEFPAREGVQASELLESWGEFKADQVDVTELGERNATAVMAMDRAGWK
ncbi:Fe(3+) ABC transporter substrate-binding protein [Halioglobus japonicus]|uniref:Fe(3+) ABC transporter substrate-binding protein n=1 Tax=Halioglobus japonicus TaxID=930805 RepID=A0AAP8MBD4_9GAMM|nr:Fe(3+) ABC transporter substrate-binding protein [Halioglobus japonicus]AQA17988.1 Fe(3+) ABC transporter substrate-binding protein [Halioglobus japonicus]PLW84544.1 Fe(3+) ABC transporter substrate-binding protein [Halioglobus japonicus]GHD24311.1 iron deficiency-induced protein A [Halioglobus japonicus]